MLDRKDEITVLAAISLDVLDALFPILDCMHLIGCLIWSMVQEIGS